MCIRDSKGAGKVAGKGLIAFSSPPLPRELSPFNVVSGLGKEEALSVGLDDERWTWVDGQSAFGAVITSAFYGDQQQLQLREAQPAVYIVRQLAKYTVLQQSENIQTYGLTCPAGQSANCQQ